MSQISVKYKSPLRGELTPPPDKSISHRAIILSSLSKGKSIIRNSLAAEDPLKTIRAFRQMGVDIEVRGQRSGVRGQESEVRTQNTEIVVNGNGLMGFKKPEKTIDCGNSGTTMRLLSGILAGQPFSSTLTGDASLIRRPMQRIITPLTEMGAIIESEKGGYPPLRIKGGKLKPINYKSPVASAQVKSAILLAGLYCNGITTISEPDKSRDHTERMLKVCGVDITEKEFEVSIKGMTTLRPLDITIPGDFSSAAFFIVAGLLVPESEILIRNTGINPTRTGLINILKLMGASINFTNKKEISGEPVADISIKHSKLAGIDIDGNMILKAIDEFPIVCVAAAKAHGTTKITGARELRIKESDRIASMTAELRKMGVQIEELEDGLIIEGGENLNSVNNIQSHGDHRIAMAMTIAGLLADGETTILNTDCIDTSFPGFMKMLESLEQ